MLTFKRLISREVVVYKNREDDMALAEKLAQQFEAPIAKAVSLLLQVQADELDMEALIEALKTGDAGAVMAVVDAAATAARAAAAGPLQYALQDAIWAAGAAGTKMVLAAPGTAPAWTRGGFVFNRLNPKLVEWVEEYDLGLIRQIDDTTREAVRDVMIKNLTEGKPPAVQAKAIKEAVGLTSRQSAAVAAYRKQLETFHTKRSAKGFRLGEGPDKVNGHNVFKPGEDGKPKDGVTERRLRDLRYDPTLKRAMETGKPLTAKQIDAQVEAYARRWRKHRATVIGRTESMRAANAGVFESFRQAIEQGLIDENLVRVFWIVAKDERTCPECNAIPKLNPKGVPMGQPFATLNGTVMMGPLHPSCRCVIFIRVLEQSQISGDKPIIW